MDVTAGAARTAYGRGAGSASEQVGLFSKAPRAKVLGRMGEDVAARSLVRRGYELLERNWTCKFGEADIIARDADGTVALVEVKTRYSRPGDTRVMPELAVDKDKLSTYRKLAQFYYAIHPELVAIRFDVVAVNLAGPETGHLKHYVNAYSWDGR